MSGSKTVVVGGGIAGMLAAHLWALRAPTSEIVLVDSSPKLGGLLGRVDGGEFGCFDLGMHTFTQTGVAELDTLLWKLLPEDEWYRFDGAKRDISGTFFQGKLQRHAHYPDLRALPAEDYQACMVDLLEHLQKEPVDSSECRDMRSYSLARFGKEVTERVIAPILQRTYGRPAEEIDPLAATFLRLDRVLLFNERLFKELTGSPTMRSRIAYPEQRNLDLKFSSGFGSYYPRKFGIYRVIEALKARLLTQGVEFASATDVTRVERDSRRITSIELSNRDRPLEVSSMIWAGGLKPLTEHLSLSELSPPNDIPLSTAVVNFLFDHPTTMEDLYYFYCLDPGYRCYRVTNFSAYCPGAPRADGWPISVEMLLEPGHTTDSEALKIRAMKELKGFGILPQHTQTLFAHTTVMPKGFPRPTVSNMKFLGDCRAAIADLRLENLLVLGKLSKPGLFFQTDVLRDVYESVMEAPIRVA